jgi:predicted lysophospholipase L1 biosynthesis ABC-type transport system permease subunit
MTRLAGRYFERPDSVTFHVAVISERMAQRYWPGADAVGKRFLFYNESIPTTVIGVVRDVRHNPNVTRDPSEAEFFIPMQPGVGWRTMSLVVRTAGDPVALAAGVQRTIGQLDPALAAGNVATLERAIFASLSPQRITTQMLALFAMIAVLLAAVGIYGVMSYAVSQRTHEIGVRVALGARDVDVVRQMLRQAGTLIALGLALGLAGGAGMAQGLRVLLYETSTTDPVTFGAVAVVLAAVALAGSYLPARRAAKVDPVVALRAEV